MVYRRIGGTMGIGHAGLINGGRCLRMKQPTVGWDDCAEWLILRNVDISGNGVLDGDGDRWGPACQPTCPDGTDATQRPPLLSLYKVDGLSIRDLRLRRPAAYTVHPVFVNNLRIQGVDIRTTGHGCDGIDPDSSWNVYLDNNTISTRDDCISIKAGKDWSGRLVNVSSENVLIERITLIAGHGVAIGSETSGWIRGVTVRDIVLLPGVEAVVRMKTMRGRGGGAERLLYERIVAHEVLQPLQITLSYKKAKTTNTSATPAFRDIVVRDLMATTNNTGLAVLCAGLPEAPVLNLSVADTMLGGTQLGQSCSFCDGQQRNTTPVLCIEADKVGNTSAISAGI